MGLRSYIDEALPFAAMTFVEFGDVGTSILFKAASNRGMSNFVYTVYYNILGICILLPHFICHSCRNTRPPLTWRLLCRFFILGLIGKSTSLLGYIGLSYSSPTLYTAMGNLIPIFTLFLAIVSRMEKLDMKSSSTTAKLLGTVVTVTGAFVVTLYRGPPIFSNTSSSPSFLHRQLLTQSSKWVLGGAILAIAYFCSASWIVLQTSTMEMYPDQPTVVVYLLCFGTLQLTAVSLLAERNPTAWKLSSEIEIIAVLYSGIYATAIRFNILTWCLRKKGPLYVAMFGPLAMIIAEFSGVMFLGETLFLGSVIGASTIAFGFYTVLWGKSKETNVILILEDECNIESSTVNSPLLQNP